MLNETVLTGRIYIQEESLDNIEGLSKLLLAEDYISFREEVKLLLSWITHAFFHKNEKKLIKIKNILENTLDTIREEMEEAERHSFTGRSLLILYQYEQVLKLEIEKIENFIKKIHTEDFIKELDSIEHGYAILDFIQHNNESNTATEKELLEKFKDTNINILEVVKKLIEAGFLIKINIGSEVLYTTTVKTISLFIFYSEAKRFTNQVEKIKRKNKKVIA